MIDEILVKFDGAFAHNTIRAYRSDFIQYQDWCHVNNIKPIPASVDHLASYVDHLSTYAKSATIRRRINSLGTILKLSKNHDPTKEPEVILALKRMHRKIGRAQKQAAPLTKILLDQLMANCDNSIIEMRNKVLLQLGYETMRRRSELCVFRFKDLIHSPNGNPAIKLTFSKTDQYGEGKLIPISKRLESLIKRWEKVVGCGGYILRGVNRHGHISDSLNPSSINSILKNLQNNLSDEFHEKPLSGHSFRVGAALDLLEKGESIEKIMLKGDWKIDSTAIKYLRGWHC
jgi:site-specific recombinase XerD